MCKEVILFLRGFVAEREDLNRAAIFYDVIYLARSHFFRNLYRLKQLRLNMSGLSYSVSDMQTQPY